MEKYKICPSCHTKNEPTFLECVSCEADLTRVKITDEETEKMIANNANEESPNSVSFVRFCECGTKNPPNARKCSNCGEDIFDIVPTPDNNEQREKSVKFVLSSTDGKYAYEIPSAEIIIGRENAMSEYLSSKSYVSRQHAKLYLTNNELFVENINNTNYTFVNNKKITDKTKLNDGDEIGLGGTSLNGKRQTEAAYFIVRIGQCM